jgi:hypothetical protein
MSKHALERDPPAAGNLPVEELQAILQANCDTSQKVEVSSRWLQNLVTGDKIHAVPPASGEEPMQEHVRWVHFPANNTIEVRAMIEPIL